MPNGEDSLAQFDAIGAEIMQRFRPKEIVSVYVPAPEKVKDYEGLLNALSNAIEEARGFELSPLELDLKLHSIIQRYINVTEGRG